jgi:hypothetical protein
VSTVRVVEFDADAVREALAKAIRDGWQTLKANAPDEHPYGMVLYEGADYGYVCVTPFTEEGLDRTVARYREGEWGDEYQGDQGRESLRWSTPDCPYHVTSEIGSPPLVSSDTTHELWKSWGEDSGPIEAYKEAIRELCMEALEQVDREGLFGVDRPAMTLMIEDRDGRESVEEFREIVARLNPPVVLDRYNQWRETLEAHWAAKRARRASE